MNKATVLAGFITGIVIGVTTGFLISKKKHEMIAQAEIDSVKQRFAERKTMTNVDDERINNVTDTLEKADIIEQIFSKDIPPVENNTNSKKQQADIIKEYSDYDEDEAEEYE